MSMRPKERVKKSKEKIEESEGNVRGFWLNCDREEQTAIEELKGAEHEWSFQEGLEAEKD
jgi:nitrate/TMAO reductase-like tetraheme cytochrome c subunit